MKDILDTLLKIVLGVGTLAVVLLAFYAVSLLMRGDARRRWQVGVFLIPALIFLAIGLFIPTCITIVHSFMNDATNNKKFVGFRQYWFVFKDEKTRLVLFTTLTWVIVGTAAVIVISLAIARFADGMRGEKFAKSMIFLPTCISLAGAGITWRFVYAGPPFENGFLNAVTKALHLPNGLGGDGQRLWFTERGIGGLTPPATAPGFNTLLLIVVFIWVQAGLSTVVFSAAMKGVPESLIEAAKVDGATNRQVFYKVTLPYIRSTIVTVATLSVIAAFKSYDVILGATGGRAGTANIAVRWYDVFFLEDREGLAAALATLLLLLVVPFVVINRRAQRRAEEVMAA